MGPAVPQIEGVAFHVVVRGTCWLLPTSDRPGPTQLFPGDLVLVRDGSAHALADHPEAPLRDFNPVLDDPASPVARSRSTDQVRQRCCCVAPTSWGVAVHIR